MLNSPVLSCLIEKLNVYKLKEYENDLKLQKEQKKLSNFYNEYYQLMQDLDQSEKLRVLADEATVSAEEVLKLEVQKNEKLEVKIK